MKELATSGGDSRKNLSTPFVHRVEQFVRTKSFRDDEAHYLNIGRRLVSHDRPGIGPSCTGRCSQPSAGAGPRDPILGPFHVYVKETGVRNNVTNCESGCHLQSTQIAAFRCPPRVLALWAEYPSKPPSLSS